ncbi:MAG: alpha/beta hydrolase [Anaerolineales bacterium]|nr:alpha/beta hydrolase [Anaerolineales bacterium]
MPTITANDIQLYYEVVGQGQPVVLISGVGQGRNYWDLAGILTTLAQDFRVISFDNRGVGQSSMPDAPYTVEMMAADTLALLDQLQLERAHIIGHSLGAMIAFELGRSHPERVGGVVMMSGLYPGPTAVLALRRGDRIITQPPGRPRRTGQTGHPGSDRPRI